MDALTLLREVSDAYRALKNLSIEATISNESGDENASQRGEYRVRFFYTAPDRIRYERCGKNGMIQVADGLQVHTSFGGRQFGNRPRYTSSPANSHRLPHLFRPDFPFAGGDEAFLYQGIEERVAAAQILRNEGGCHVISVTYEPSRHAAFFVSGFPILFWLDVENRIVMRQEGEVGYRTPAEEEINWSRHTVAVRKASINEPIPEDTFRFTPPPDAKLEQGGCVFGGGSSGFIESSSDNQRRLEHRGSHEWDGDTLIEHSKWKMRGMTLHFERRLTFSPDGKELRVAERITGPKGEVKGDHSLPVE